MENTKIVAVNNVVMGFLPPHPDPLPRGARESCPLSLEGNTCDLRERPYLEK
jgi:hypothetical protein